MANPTYTEFITEFPEFDTRVFDVNNVLIDEGKFPQAKIERIFTQVQRECNDYVGLGDNAEYAIYLHTAHYLTVYSMNATSSNTANGNRVTKVKSRNEEITYANVSGVDKQASEYGQRLDSFITNNDSMYMNFFF